MQLIPSTSGSGGARWRGPFPYFSKSEVRRRRLDFQIGFPRPLRLAQPIRMTIFSTLAEAVRQRRPELKGAALFSTGGNAYGHRRPSMRGFMRKISTRIFRWPTPADRHRPRPGAGTQTDRSRMNRCPRSGCFHPVANSQSHLHRFSQRPRPDDDFHFPRSRRRPLHRGPDRRHVSGKNRRVRACG